ncbi:glycosyltransferase [Turicibacter sanguinis]|uniref:glycosyltransferase n=1 Tax=Turicibacter sanguinis TaxID=154288 RepID=UPI0018AB0C1B|nr:glycosyltransferase [Turicibacter sanguinis]MDB8567897.1 glycosyltransferase [Turicibacter sanguinis]MDB8570646.1 glycosyltransferase [Turicibacter sanguinis]MDB8573399.1 glycosyltransferase [Turicibacter sanguinis]MDB8582159.1 glycosyltransferase [Turicibacter sanguinis]
MKKIAFLFETVYKAGGVSRVLVILANELANRGYSVDIIHQEKNTEYMPYYINCNVGQKYYKFNKRNLFQKISKKILFNTSFEKIYFNKKSLSNDINILNNYDVIIGVHGSNTIYLGKISNLLKKDIKKIGWQHNSFEAYFESKDYYKNEKNLVRKYIGYLDWNVVLTESDERLYNEHFYNKNIKISNPLTINTDKITTLENKEIIFVGRLVREQKGLDYLIEIAQRIKPFKWKIRVVGDGPDYKWLTSLIQKKDLDDIIILEGLVTDNIDNLYSSASIFISTSRWEGFGLVITEAMSCGLPIVSFENTGPSEILKNGEYGIIISKYNIEDFSNAIIDLITDENKLKYYKNKSLERVQQFKIDEVLKKWEFLINE